VPTRIATLATVFVFGAVYIPSVAKIAEGEPTPWPGVVERVSFGAWLLWIAFLAITLLRAGGLHQTPKEGPRAGRG
jgi:hypothetical protein